MKVENSQEMKYLNKFVIKYLKKRFWKVKEDGIRQSLLFCCVHRNF